MSLEKYNQLEKAARNYEYLAMIDRGIAQLEAGRGQEHEWIEVDEWKNYGLKLIKWIDSFTILMKMDFCG